MEKAFLWAFNHYALLATVIAIAAIALLWKVGRPRRFRGWLADAVLIVALLVTGCWTYFVAQVTNAIEHRTNTLTFATLDSHRSQRVADLRGNVIVLNFWATWCPPCHHEMPDLNRLADAYRGRNVVVLTVSDEDESMLQKYVTKYPLTTRVARFASDRASTPLQAMAYGGRPTTVVLDRDGNIRQLFIGAQSFDDFDRAVRKLL